MNISNKNKFKTSVALCTYNGELYLFKQLESILLQKPGIDEIIICDDNSTDDTFNIIMGFKEKHPQLIRFYQNENRLGAVKNFEKAIKLTTGDLIFLSDQDDIWCENKVKIIMNYFILNNKCKLLFTNGLLIDENEKPINSSLWKEWSFTEEIKELWRNNNNAFKDLLVNKNKITGATICFHNSLKTQTIPIEVPIDYWHDAWLGIHAAAINGLCFIDIPLIKYRIHSKQLIGINKRPQAQTGGKIDKIKFFKRLKDKYPKKKHLFPLSERKSVKEIFFKIFKKIIK